MTEPEILDFWNKRKIFEKSLDQTKDGKPFVFYEGPPTANGRPGIHHLEARAFKDAIPRYQTMRGRYVRRKAGWDTHGLPVELEVEKTLGLRSKKEIETYGIARFNEECRKSVGKYLDEWGKFTDRIGYWVDQAHSYFTYQNSYIESLWSVLGEANKRELLYKDYKVVPWCPRCGTGLSSHELAQGYQDVKDLSLYVKFKVKEGQKIGDWFSDGKTYILAWTTTPWTLPGNVALAVGNDIDYVRTTENGENLILARSKLGIIKSIVVSNDVGSGKNLVGLEYEPLYPLTKEAKPKGIEKAYKVYPADFVTTEDGTGIVHTAVMYGADDFALGTEVGLPKHHLVGEDGRFLPGTGFLEGRLVTETDVAVDILKDLEKRGLFFRKESYTHSYPFCWRCKSKLIYFARDSWYIRMSELRDDLLHENKSINWEPAHIREGRFGEWLRDVKDWAISRERYWGTPLPIWETADGKERFLVTSVERLKEKAKKSGNRYFVMRHGEAVSNIEGVIDSYGDPKNHLTERGKEQARAGAEKLKGEGITRIITSPLIRASETAEIVREVLGLPKEAVSTEKRFAEFDHGKALQGERSETPETDASEQDRLYAQIDGSESLASVRKRVLGALADIEKEIKGETVLVVTHGSPMWMILAGARALDEDGTFEFRRAREDGKGYFIKNTEAEEFEFWLFPHNEEWELDLHRPHIDDIVLLTDDGREMRRVKEVVDVWFDSGAMPFAQDHYPFENKEYVDSVGYPADFICEAIDQTRGWFYTLHAVGAIMGRGRAYKNVISLGHILDNEGKKMSKSVGNVVDPWAMIEKYGTDTLRFWMYSVNQPGDSKNFDEKTVAEAKKTFTLLSNVLSFYDLYRDRSLEERGGPPSENVLDAWILARLDELIGESTRSLDAFKLLESTRAIRLFVDDLSTWYLRRSRDAIKDGNADAKRTLYFVLKTLSKVIAPFAPFAAEDVYQRLRADSDAESVHLSSWPRGGDADREIIEKMKETRSIVEKGLALRAEAGIKVRQPLASFAVPESTPPFFPELVQDELNVKEVVRSGTPGLDTSITPDLREEGIVREMVRKIQDTRKAKMLRPSDRAALVISTNEEGKKLLESYEAELSRVSAERISYVMDENVEMIEHIPFGVAIEDL